MMEKKQLGVLSEQYSLMARMNILNEEGIVRDEKNRKIYYVRDNGDRVIIGYICGKDNEDVYIDSKYITLSDSEIEGLKDLLKANNRNGGPIMAYTDVKAKKDETPNQDEFISSKYKYPKSNNNNGYDLFNSRNDEELFYNNLINTDSVSLIDAITTARYECSRDMICGYDENTDCPTLNWSKYTLEKVIEMSNRLKGKKFEVVDGSSDENFIELIKSRLSKEDIKSYKSYEPYKKNYSGRDGYIYELLLGNIPDNASYADFYNDKDSAKSVEAKAKTSHIPAISIYGGKMESIASQMERVSDDIRNELNDKIVELSNKLNQVVRDAILNDLDSKKFDLLSLVIKNSRIVTLNAIGNENAQELNLHKNSSVSNENNFLCEIVAYYGISPTRMGRKIKYGKKSYVLEYTQTMNQDKTSFIVQIYIPSIKFTEPIILEIPLLLLAEKLLQKCPNIAIAYTSENRIQVKHGEVMSYNTVYEFKGFEFYKQNANTFDDKKLEPSSGNRDDKTFELNSGNRDKVVMGLNSMLSNKFLTQRLQIIGNAKKENSKDGSFKLGTNAFSSGSKQFDTLTINFSQSFDPRKFASSISANKLYEKV